MRPNKEYTSLPKDFWANIKLLSEEIGYSSRGNDKLKTYSIKEIIDCLKKKELDTAYLKIKINGNNSYLETLVGYLNYRSECLLKMVKPNLMDRNSAKTIFKRLKRKLSPKCKLPMNKQKGDKKHYSYLTCIVNMLTESALRGDIFDQDPHSLTIITKNKRPIRTFTRRFDGVYPSVINPKAIWEVKEYYGTTTFGSRVADGVYESMLDGEELQELRENEGIEVKHYLIVDDYFTWWVKGKSYLCRLIDMLHMGYVDEVLFGKETVKRWPQIVKSWK
jgi:hypothetical protein